MKVLSELQKRAENWVFWRRKQKCVRLNKLITSGLDLKAYVAKRRIADKLDPIGSAKKLAESLARIEKDPLVIKERKIIKRMDPYTQCTELGYRISREYLSDPKKFY